MLHYKAEEEFQRNASVAIKKTCDYRGEEIHDHDFIEIVYIIEGAGRHCINGEEFEVKAGDLLFINYGCTHAFYLKDKLMAYNLMIRVDYFTENMLKADNLFYMLALTSFEKIQGELNDKSPLVTFDYNERENMYKLFEYIEEELSKNELGKNLVLDSYINIILCKVFRKIFVKENEKNNLIPQDILDYIAEHFHEKISLNDLSQRCFYNPAYFSRLFKKTFNMSFTDYIMDVRLKHCSELLINSDYAIERIIRESGFFDRNTFYDRFKNKYGCTPSEYRNMQSKKDDNT
jgi:AraC-like DNA-binding protein